MAPGTRNKLLILAILAAAGLWYFMAPTKVDENAARAAYEASRQGMQTAAGTAAAAPAPAPSAPKPPEPAPPVSAPTPAAPPPAAAVTPPTPAAPAVPDEATATAPEQAASPPAAEAPAVVETTPPKPTEVPPAAAIAPEEKSVDKVTEAPAVPAKPKRVKRTWASLSPAERDGFHALDKKVSDKEWTDVTRGLASAQETVRENETLEDVARRVYGDGNLWPKLWSINPQISNPYQPNVGEAVRTK